MRNAGLGSWPARRALISPDRVALVFGDTSTTYINSYVMTFTVWTLTPYGWTAESAHSAQVFCS